MLLRVNTRLANTTLDQEIVLKKADYVYVVHDATEVFRRRESKVFLGMFRR